MCVIDKRPHREEREDEQGEHAHRAQQRGAQL
jgi:hypothetical protein